LECIEGNLAQKIAHHHVVGPETHFVLGESVFVEMNPCSLHDVRQQDAHAHTELESESPLFFAGHF